MTSDALKLVALDPDDLSVIAAHLQDAVIRTGDLTYLPQEQRFVLLARRFDWEAPKDAPRRRLAGMHFERVRSVRTRGIDRERADLPLDLLTITFTASEAPAGTAELVFAGGGSVQVELECVEALLKDLGPVWAAESRPAHEGEATADRRPGTGPA